MTPVLKGREPLLFVAFLLVTGIIIGKNIPLLSAGKSLEITFGLVFVLITFFSPKSGLYLVIFSMLLSPELKIASFPGRDLVIRLEDLLLLVITVTWLARTAIYKELNLFKKNPLNLPIVLYLLCCILATFFGAISGNVNIFKASFYLLKYAEYFILYFMVVNLLRTKKEAQQFLTVFFVVCFIVSIYGLASVSWMGRATAPFEGVEGEPNTFGGYLILLFGVASGLFLYNPKGKQKILLGFFLVAIFPTILFTLSRATYMGFPFVLLTLFLSKEHRKKVFLYLTLGLLIGSLAGLPSPVRNRIKYTFTPEKGAETAYLGRVGFDPSTSARVVSWRQCVRMLKERPILGYGVTGLHFIDSQYVKDLGETGILGVSALFFLLFSLFKNIYKRFREIPDLFYKGLSLGLLAGLSGLAIHAIGSNTFMIIRIMEPFWFFTALVMALPESELTKTDGKSELRPVPVR